MQQEGEIESIDFRGLGGRLGGQGNPWQCAPAGTQRTGFRWFRD